MIFSNDIKKPALYLVLHVNEETYNIAELETSVENLLEKRFLELEEYSAQNWRRTFDCYCETKLRQGELVMGQILKNEKDSSDYEVLKIVV